MSCSQSDSKHLHWLSPQVRTLSHTHAQNSRTMLCKSCSHIRQISVKSSRMTISCCSSVLDTKQESPTIIQLEISNRKLFETPKSALYLLPTIYSKLDQLDLFTYNSNLLMVCCIIISLKSLLCFSCRVDDLIGLDRARSIAGTAVQSARPAAETRVPPPTLSGRKETLGHRQQREEHPQGQPGSPLPGECWGQRSRVAANFTDHRLHQNTQYVLTLVEL